MFIETWAMDHFLFVNHFAQACQVLEAVTVCHGVATQHTALIVC